MTRTLTGEAGSPRDKGVAYAEDVLAVHKVFTDAQAADADLLELRKEIRHHRDKRSEYEQAIIDREIEITDRERSAHPESSEAALSRHLKVVLRRDDTLKKIRVNQSAITQDLHLLEDMAGDKERQIRMLTARMEQLGGLLNY